MTEILDLIAAVLLLAMVPPATLFPILYGLRSPWRASPVGRGLMLSSVGMALLVDFAALFQVLAIPSPEWLRAVVFAVIVAGLYYQLANLIRAQRRSRRSQSKDDR